LTNAIQSLSDAQAVRALRQYVRGLGQDTDPAAAEHLREAAAEPALAVYLDPADHDIDDGALARAALAHLALSQPRAVEDAIEAAETVTTYDPLTIAVGGLVIVALQTELELTRDEEGRWRLRIHKQAMRDSTLSKLLTKLIGLYRPDGK